MVVTIIGDAFPPIVDGARANALSAASSATIGMIARLASLIPEELLPRTVRDYAVFVAAVGALESAVDRWRGMSVASADATPLSETRPFGGRSAMAALYEILSKCPDEAPAMVETGLSFIKNDSIRFSILTDIGNTERTLEHREWKAATVLAGAVCEALLLWAVSQRSLSDISDAATKWKKDSPGDYKARVEKDNPEDWFLGELVEIGYCLDEVTDVTRKAVRLTKDFRNLIHPGRVLRTGADSTQGTAMMASGAMREVVRDLEMRHP